MSNYLNVNSKDLLKGLLVAFLTAFLTGIYTAIDDTHSIATTVKIYLELVFILKLLIINN